MPGGFTRNKITTSVIFYRTGVPDNNKIFSYLATQNYSMLKQKYIYNKYNNKNNRPNYTLFSN